MRSGSAICHALEYIVGVEHIDGAYDGIFNARWCDLVADLNDIIYPLEVFLKGVGRNSDDLGVAGEELRLSALV